MENNKVQINTDKPLERAIDAFPERKYFADELAKLILAWRHKDSWVIGLTGKWGLGKTSIKNLVVEKIEKENKETIIVEFSPWQWSSQDLITKAFFDTLEKEVRKKNKAVSKNIRNYINHLNQNNSYINYSLEPFSNYAFKILAWSHNIYNLIYEPIVKLLPVFGMGILISDFFSTEVKAFFFVLFGVLFVLGVSNQLYEYLNKKRNALYDYKDSLNKSLNSLKSPLLVIIDDVDRLNKHQLEQLLQLVKSNLDMNNIIFLLLYSKEVVEKKLTDESQSGTEYMEKIVQFEVCVPKVEDEQLKQIFVKDLNALIDELNIKNAQQVINSTDFHEVFNSLMTYFNDMRSINRFFNSLRFSLNSLVQNNYLEVNIVDFIILETFKLNRFEIYELIKNSKDFLTGKSYFDRKKRPSKNDETKKEILSFLDEFSENDNLLVKYLFPVLNEIRGRNKSLDKLNICYEERFENYFLLSNSRFKISYHELIGIEKKLKDSNQSLKLISEIFVSPKKDSFMTQIEEHYNNFDDNQKINLAIALSLIIEITNDDGILSERSSVEFLIVKLIKSIKNKNSQFEALKQLCQSKEQILTGIDLVYAIEKDKSSFKIDEIQLTEFISLLQTKIVQFITNSYDEFMAHSFHRTILFFWLNKDSQYSKAFIINKLNNSKSFCSTLDLFIILSTRTSGYSSYKHKSFDRKLLKEFMTEEEFESVMNSALSSDPTNEKLIEIKSIYDNKDDF